MLVLSGKSAENHAYLLVISDDKHLKEGADSLEFQMVNLLNFQWNFHGISVEFQWNFRGISVEFPWNFSSISAPFKLQFRPFSAFIQWFKSLKFSGFRLYSAPPLDAIEDGVRPSMFRA